MVGADDPKAAGMGPVPVEPKAPVPKPPNYPPPAASEGIKRPENANGLTQRPYF